VVGLFEETGADMKSYILWDHDGVLVETEPWYFEATRQTIRELGVKLDHAAYLQDMAAGRSAWERARALGASEAAVSEGKQRRNRLYQRLLREQDIEIPGVSDVLETLAPRFAMAIVTTAKKADFELIHRNRDIVPHMRFVLANGDYRRSKPAPDPYLAALDRFGAAATEAVVIEDSERGLRAAVAAGIDCVVVANGFVAGQDFSAATHRIDSIRELPALLDSL
jgi:HAD superfamily hydrolase (TIGR01509 family)